MPRYDTPARSSSRSNIDYDGNAVQAEASLDLLLSKMTPEEKKGAETLIEWQQRWLMEVGHKRIGRILFAQKMEFFPRPPQAMVGRYAPRGSRTNDVEPE